MSSRLNDFTFLTEKLFTLTDVSIHQAELV